MSNIKPVSAERQAQVLAAFYGIAEMQDRQHGALKARQAEELRGLRRRQTRERHGLRNDGEVDTFSHLTRQGFSASEAVAIIKRSRRS